MGKKGTIALIIIIILQTIIIAGLVTGFVIYYNNTKDTHTEEKEKKLEETWAETYYEYLNNEDILPSNSKNTTLRFIDIPEEKNPVMVIEYEKDKKTYTDLYIIMKDEVKKLETTYPSKIKLLYYLDNEEHNYYYEITNKNKYYYETVFYKIATYKDGEDYDALPPIEFTKESETIKDSNGNKVEMTDFDKKYVEIEEEKLDYIDLENASKKELKEIIENAIETYKKQDTSLNKETKDKIKETEKKLDKIEEIEENNRLEEEKKKAEEEEKKKQEEAKKAEEEKKKQEAAKKEKDKQTQAQMETNFYNKVKGFYCNSSNYTCVNIYKKNGKAYYENFVYASEFGSVSEIKSITYEGNNIYKLQLAKSTVKVNISNISKKTMTVNGTTVKFITTDRNKIGNILLGY